LPQRALSRLAHHRKCFGHELVQGRALGEPLLELVRLGAQFLIAEVGDGLLQRVHLCRDAVQLLEDLALTQAQDLIEDRRHTYSRWVGSVRCRCGHRGQYSMVCEAAPGRAHPIGVFVQSTSTPCMPGAVRGGYAGASSIRCGIRKAPAVPEHSPWENMTAPGAARRKPRWQ